MAENAKFNAKIFDQAIKHKNKAEANESKNLYYDAYVDYKSALTLLNLLPVGFNDSSAVRYASVGDVKAAVNVKLSELEPLLTETLAKIKEQKLESAVGGATTVNPELEAAVKFACTTREYIGSESNPDSCNFWFSMIIGQEEAKSAIINGFINPILFPNVYGEMTSGIMFYGLPGTGKTLLARATVNELARKGSIPGSMNPCVNVILFAPTGANLKGKYVGETEKNIKMMFTGASETARRVAESTKKRTLALIFIDEIDGVVPDRATAGEGAISVVPAVNTMLQMMDSFGKKSNVIVMGATNFLSTIDSAVRRRFTQKILVDMPKNTSDYEKLIGISLKKFLKSSISPEKYKKDLGGIQENKVRFNSCENMDFCKWDDKSLAEVPWDWMTLPSAALISPMFTETAVYKLAQKMMTTTRKTGKDVFGPLSPSDVVAVMSTAFKLAADSAVNSNRITKITMEWEKGKKKDSRSVIGMVPTLLQNLKQNQEEFSRLGTQMDIGTTEFTKAYPGVFSEITINGKPYFNKYRILTVHECANALGLDMKEDGVRNMAWEHLIRVQMAVQNETHIIGYSAIYYTFDKENITFAYDNVVKIRCMVPENKALRKPKAPQMDYSPEKDFYVQKDHSKLEGESVPYHIIYIAKPKPLPESIIGGIGSAIKKTMGDIVSLPLGPWYPKEALDIRNVFITGYGYGAFMTIKTSKESPVLHIIPVSKKVIDIPIQNPKDNTPQNLVKLLSDSIGEFVKNMLYDTSLPTSSSGDYVNDEISVIPDGKAIYKQCEYKLQREHVDKKFLTCDTMFEDYVNRYCYDISPDFIEVAINSTLPSISQTDKQKMSI